MTLPGVAVLILEIDPMLNLYHPVSDLLVNGQLQKRRWRIHFSIGQAY
jgi:hypothetical protein